MNYRVEYTRDVIGNNYLVVKFNENTMEPFMKDLYEIVDSNSKFDTLINNQKKRDRRGDAEHTHHMTVMNVMELQGLLSQYGSKLQERISAIQSVEVNDLEMRGVGKAERNDNVAYFVVCYSEIINEMRSTVGLPPRDMHITLGFDKKDVFGVRKNEVIKKKSRLSKIVDHKYSQTDGSHKWIHEIGNIKDALKLPDDKIEILYTTDTILTLKMNHTQVQIGLINQGNGEELWVLTTCEYGKDKE